MIKKGVKVKILAGKDKKKEGDVIESFHEVAVKKKLNNTII